MPSSNNILLVSNYPSDTGYAWWLMEVFWLEIAKLNTAGNTYLAYPEVNKISDRIATSNINVTELPFNLDNGTDSSKLLDFIRDKKINRIYLTDQPYFNWQYWKLRSAGVTHIINHDHTPGDRPDINGIFGWIKSIRNRLPAVTVNAVFNVSPLMKERSIKNGRIPENRIYSIQNGINYTKESSSASLISLRDELNIPENTTVIVTSSRLHPYKRVDHALQIFDLCYKGSSNLHMIIIGDGPDRERLEKIKDNMACSQNIHFLGFRNDIDRLLEHSDIALHCAQGEGFSLSILEYMSAALPVITPDIPSVCQANSQGKTGYIYQDSNFKEASKFILKLVESKSEREKLSKTAQETVKEHYSLSNTIHQFREAIFEMGFTSR